MSGAVTGAGKNIAALQWQSRGSPAVIYWREQERRAPQRRQGWGKTVRWRGGRGGGKLL